MGTGFKYVIFTLNIGGMIQFDEHIAAYVSNGLVQPPTSIFLLVSFFSFGPSSKKKVLDLKDNAQSGWSRNLFVVKFGFAIAANYMYVLEGLKHHP